MCHATSFAVTPPSSVLQCTRANSLIGVASIHASILVPTSHAPSVSVPRRSPPSPTAASCTLSPELRCSLVHARALELPFVVASSAIAVHRAGFAGCSSGLCVASLLRWLSRSLPPRHLLSSAICSDVFIAARSARFCRHSVVCRPASAARIFPLASSAYVDSQVLVVVGIRLQAAAADALRSQVIR